VKVGDNIVSKAPVINLGKVIGIVTGFDQDKDPMYSVIYSTTGKGFGLSLNYYKSHYRVIKDEQVPEVIHHWGSTTPVVEG